MTTHTALFALSLHPSSPVPGLLPLSSTLIIPSPPVEALGRSLRLVWEQKQIVLIYRCVFRSPGADAAVPDVIATRA